MNDNFWIIVFATSIITEELLIAHNDKPRNVLDDKVSAVINQLHSFNMTKSLKHLFITVKPLVWDQHVAVVSTVNTEDRCWVENEDVVVPFHKDF